MKRRLFIKNASTGLLAASAAALVPGVVSAAEMMKQPATSVKMNRKLLSINFKGMTFKATSAQKSAFSRLPADVRGKLAAPKKGAKILSVGQLNDIARANAILKAHGEATMSTIMCPW